MERQINEMMPDAWHIFFHHRKPLPIQAKSMLAILRGNNVLISSPTASGKTEAVLAPLYQRHVSFRRSQVGTIWVAPTKALVNDIFYRVGDYLGGTRSMGGVYRYTGDHHDFNGQDEGFLLIATPEALDSLQLVRPDTLRSIRAVVFDEIHFLHGTPRGQQLRSVVARIKTYLKEPSNPKDTFQLIGTSATIDDVHFVKSLWLGDNSQYISDDIRRKLEVEYLKIPNGPINETCSEIGSVIEKWQKSAGVSKLLIFTNTRNDAHMMAIALRRVIADLKCPVLLHIGIMSGSERDRVETEMKSARKAVCVATSTLEIGIDIGDIDCVILYSPTRSINAFLQRIGRGNRRSNVSRVVCLFRNTLEKDLYEALVSLARQGSLDELHEYDRPSVRVQQIISHAWSGLRNGRPLNDENLSHRTGESGFESVISDMVNNGHLKVVGGYYVPSDELMDQGDRREIHTVIASGSEKAVIDAQTGEILAKVSGHLEEGMVYLGGKVKMVENSNQGTMILESSRTSDFHMISKIPATSSRSGLPRRIIWQYASLAGKNPRIWHKTGHQLMTWGGLDNNRLLAILCEMHGLRGISADNFGLVGVPDFFQLNPDVIKSWVEDGSLAKLPLEGAKHFRQPSKYFSLLGNELKSQEIRAAIPTGPFKAWIDDCIKNNNF